MEKQKQNACCSSGANRRVAKLKTAKLTNHYQKKKLSTDSSSHTMTFEDAPQCTTRNSIIPIISRLRFLPRSGAVGVCATFSLCVHPAAVVVSAGKGAVLRRDRNFDKFQTRNQKQHTFGHGLISIMCIYV